MIKRVVVGIALVLSLGLTPAFGEDVKVRYPIKEALEIGKVKSLFTDDISFYWGGEAHPPVTNKIGTFKTSKRTNAFMKDRGDACGWAMASALVALRDRAVREGGNAVVNIVSNIKDFEESSETEFSCLAGSIMVNVALKGSVVTIEK